VRAASKIVLVSVLCCLAHAQRIHEHGEQVAYEDAHGRKTPLGRGHSAVPLPDGRILFVQGARMSYGERLACTKPEARNRVAVFDPATGKSSVIYDKPLTNGFVGPDDACIFEHAELSGDKLYVVTPWAATSNMLAIVNLKTGEKGGVEGVVDAWVIRGGPSEGDLIYTRRMWDKSPEDGLEYPHYPFIHAKPDGKQIAIISDETFTVGRTETAPVLRAYLRRLGGRIYVCGDDYAEGGWIP